MVVVFLCFSGSWAGWEESHSRGERGSPMRPAGGLQQSWCSPRGLGKGPGCSPPGTLNEQQGFTASWRGCLLPGGRPLSFLKTSSDSKPRLSLPTTRWLCNPTAPVITDQLGQNLRKWDPGASVCI